MKKVSNKNPNLFTLWKNTNHLLEFERRADKNYWNLGGFEYFFQQHSSPPQKQLAKTN